MHKKCLICSKLFKCSYHAQTICSEKCKIIRRREHGLRYAHKTRGRVDFRPCVTCGHKFHPTTNDITCSDDCRIIYRRKVTREGAQRRRHDNPNKYSNYRRAWRQANPEKMRQYGKNTWQKTKTDPELMRRKQNSESAYYQNNREKRIADTKQYQKQHPDKVRQWRMANQQRINSERNTKHAEVSAAMTLVQALQRDGASALTKPLHPKVLRTPAKELAHKRAIYRADPAKLKERNRNFFARHPEKRSEYTQRRQAKRQAALKLVRELEKNSIGALLP